MNIANLVTTLHAAVVADTPTFTGITLLAGQPWATVQCDNSATFAPKKPTTLVEGMVHAVATALDHADMKFLAAEKLGPHWPDVAAEATAAGLLTPRCRLTPLGREMAESNGWLPANPNPNPTHNPNKDTNMSLLSSDSYTVNITDAKAPAAKAWALANLTTHAEVAHAMHAEAMRVKPRKSVNSALDAIAQRFQAEDAALAKAEDSAATDGDTSAPAAPKVVAAVAAVVAPPAPPVTRTLADCKAYAASVQTTEDHCTDAENLRALATLAAMVLAIPDAPVKAAKARSPRKARTAAVKPYPQPRTDTLADVAEGEWFTRNGRDAHLVLSVADSGARVTLLVKDGVAIGERSWTRRDADLPCGKVAAPGADAANAAARHILAAAQAAE